PSPRARARRRRTTMQAWIKIRRNQVILGGLILVLLAAAYHFMGSGGGGTDSGPITAPASGGTSQPTPTPATGKKNKKNQNQNKPQGGATGKDPVQVLRRPAGAAVQPGRRWHDG